MAIVPTPRLQFVDQNGLPLAGAKAYFYQTGTTTPVAVYSDAALTIPISQPVTADAQGLFPAMYLPTSALYRMKLITATGSLGTPLLDVDPVNQTLSIGAANIQAGAIESYFGYTPVNPAAAVFPAVTRLQISGSTLRYNDEVGYIGAPLTQKNANYTFALDDSGHMFVKDDTSTPTWTIPPNASVAFPVGHCIHMTVLNTGSVTIARGAGVALRIAGSATDGSKTLAQWGLVTIRQVAANSWIATGAGIS